jgi:hypothetical protein
MNWLADTTDFSPAGQPDAVRAFFADYANPPDWADPDRMKAGRALFKKHAGLIGLILGTYSLPYTYMGANGVQLLWLTERIKNDTARRLQETGEWVFGVHNSKEWISGRAIARTLKIRLIHAGARWFGLQSGRWNAEWGAPVNRKIWREQTWRSHTSFCAGYEKRELRLRSRKKKTTCIIST